jgi:hypothetical protein
LAIRIGRSSGRFQPEQSNVGDSRWLRLTFCFRSEAGPVGLGRFDFRIAARDTFPSCPIAASARSKRSATAPVARNVLTCDRPAAPKQSARPGNYRRTRHDRDRVDCARRHRSASLEVYQPFSTRRHAQRACVGVPKRPASERSLSHDSKRCCSKRRTFWGGSFVTCQATTSTRSSHRLRSNRAGVIGESDFDPRTLAIDPAMSSDPAYNSCRPSKLRVMHRRVLHLRGVPLREVDFYAALPDEGSSKPPSTFRPAALLGSLSGPSQVCSRPMGEPSPFLALGPTCRFARRASASINFRRGDSIAETIESGRAVAFDFWALTPICDPNPSALKPGDRSCLGLCLLQGLPDACLRTQTGSTPY